jgi:hypothetical protein
MITPGDPAMSDELKRCPFCDEEIRVNALICKHCRQWMPGYTYESAIRDLVIAKQVTDRNIIEAVESQSREEQLEIALNWAKGDKSVSLQRADLAAQNLSGIDLSGADLSEADLRETDLSQANLKEAVLTKANLFRANLKGANLRKANLTEASLRDADLERAEFSGAKLL